jgi:hypothetical protein
MRVDRNNCKVIPKDILFGYNGNALQVKANTSVEVLAIGAWKSVIAPDKASHFRPKAFGRAVSLVDP